MPDTHNKKGKSSKEDSQRVLEALDTVDSHETEVRFRQIVDNMGEAFFMATPDLQNFLYVSPAYETIWGRSREILYASPILWLKSIYRADRRHVTHVAKTHSEHSGQQEFEYRIARSDGDIRWIRSRIIALRNEQGEHYRSVGYSEDITAQKHAEETLVQSHEDLEKRVRERTEELIDLNEKILEKERVLTATHEMGKSVLGSIDLEEVLDTLGRNLVKAGQFRSLMIALVNDANHTLEVVRGLSRFAGERGTLDEPQVVYRRQGLIYNLDSPNIVAEVARTGRIAIIDGWDDRFDSDIDDKNRKLYENKISYFVPIKHGQRVLAVIATASTREDRNDIVRNIELMQPLLDQIAIALDHANLYKKADDHRQQIETSNRHLRREVVDRQQAEAALKEALEAAKAASEAKSDFLANMSHEIRTPINGILGMAQLLRDTTLDKEQCEYIDLLLTSGSVLLRVVNDVLDFSKIEAGKLDIEYIPFNLVETASNILSTLGLSARDKGLALLHNIAPDVPHHLMGDPGRLQQIFFNLVGNAVKFTPTGKIDIHIGLDSQTETDVVLHTTVTDTGIGIPKDRQATIFESFTQADTSHTRRYGGSGLGLAITARLVTMMDGKIWVESEEDKGSTFHFTMACGIANESEIRPKSPAVSAPTTRSLNILLAEDNPVNQRLTLRLLEKQNHKVTIVDNGQKAVHAVQKDAFDLVLMDVQMPEMDGLEASREIRRHKQTVPIIALTAHAMEEDRQRCLDAGMDGYLSKPIIIEELHRTLVAIANS